MTLRTVRQVFRRQERSGEAAELRGWRVNSGGDGGGGGLTSQALMLQDAD